MSVQLRLENPGLLTSLLAFLRKRGCAAERVGEDTIEVDLPQELHLEQARTELDLYLRVWQSLHRWTQVDVVD